MPVHGIEPVTVPGSVDGWQKMLDRFGKKKMNEVLAPAIQVAEDGYPVTEWVRSTLCQAPICCARLRRRRTRS
jgi:gamma-glutamyltranspeptidase / glutathione hydrolase